MIGFRAFAIVCEAIAYKNDINYSIKKIPILDMNTKYVYSKHFKHFVFSINFFKFFFFKFRVLKLEKKELLIVLNF
jgi:hypothetical protein